MIEAYLQQLKKSFPSDMIAVEYIKEEEREERKPKLTRQGVEEFFPIFIFKNK